MSPDFPETSGEASRLLICCSNNSLAEALLSKLRSVRASHFGLLAGWEGVLKGNPIRVAVGGCCEDLAYSGVRQMCSVFNPSRVIYYATATAVSESFWAGDLAVATAARRCYCPPVVTDNMFAPCLPLSQPTPPSDTSLDLQLPELARADTLVFPSEGLRRKDLTSAEAISSAELTQRLLAKEVRTAAVGTAAEINWNARAAEYLRWRYALDLVDTGSYGALTAAADAGVPAAAFLVVTAGRSGEVAWEYERRSRHYLQRAARVLYNSL